MRVVVKSTTDTVGTITDIPNALEETVTRLGIDVTKMLIEL